MLKNIKIMRVLKNFYFIIFLILFWSFLFACTNEKEIPKERIKSVSNYTNKSDDSLFFYLDSIFKTQDDNSTKIQYYVVLDSVYKIKYPKLKNQSFDSFVQNLKNFMLTQNLCDSPLDTFTPQINIEYNVLTVTKNFLSIEENVSVLYCSIEHSFKNYYNVLLILPEKQMYIVELNDRNEDLKKIIKKDCEKRKIEYDCKCDINEELIELFFKNKKPYIYYSEGGLCKFSIPLNIIKRNYFRIKLYSDKDMKYY